MRRKDYVYYIYHRSGLLHPQTDQSVTKPSPHNTTRENNMETRKRKRISQMSVNQREYGRIYLMLKPFHLLRDPAFLNLLKMNLPLP